MSTISKEHIESLIASEEYTTVGNKTTVCILTLINGFEVIGTASPVDPADYSLEMGKKPAREKAFNKIWELEGYRSSWDRSEAGNAIKQAKQ